MNAIAYTRCSTQEQADSGLGLEVQRERIQAYCAMRKLDLLEVISDAGVSGGKPLANREGGSRLLDMIAKRKAQAVVMLKLDRMFRNAGDCLSTIEKWEKAGVGLHVIDLGGNAVDTTSAAGRFMLVILAGAAEMERNLIRERTKSALAVKKANGQRTGTVPYGYDLAVDGVALVENAAEQETIAIMLDMHHHGATLKRIAAELTTRKIPTKTGRSSRWTHQTVARIIRRS